MADLPAAGGTTPGERLPAQVDPSHLSIEEAARVFRASASTIRRKNRDGEIPGAKQVTGPSGDRWVFPVEVLDRLFNRREIEEEVPQPDQVATPSGDVAALVEAMRSLTSQLSTRQNLLEAAEEDRERVRREKEEERVRAAGLAAELEAEKRVSEDLRERLEAAENRGLFRRRKRRKPSQPE